MDRRTFLRGSVASTGLALTGVSTANQAIGSIGPIAIDTAASIVTGGGAPLTDASRIPLWAPPSAVAEGDPGTVQYGDDDVPLVAVEDGVVLVGSPVAQDTTDFTTGTEEFLCALLSREVSGGTVRYDTTADPYVPFSSYESFASYLSSETALELQPTADLRADLSSASGLVVPLSRREYSAVERNRIVTFAAGGGTLILLGHGRTPGFDGLGGLNELASQIGVDLQFGQTTVVDGGRWQFSTDNGNTEDFGGLFADRSGIEDGYQYDPTQSYAVDVTRVDHGDSVTVRFDDDTERTVSLPGVDTPADPAVDPSRNNDLWPGLGDRVALDEFLLPRGCSLYADDGTGLTVEDGAVLLTESSAGNVDVSGDGTPVDYGTEGAIPVVAISGSVAGFSAPLVSDTVLATESRYDNEELVLSIWESLFGVDATVRWRDDTVPPLDLDAHSHFASYASANGISLQSDASIPTDDEAVDGLVVPTPTSPLSDSELSDLSSFVSAGGSVLLQGAAESVVDGSASRLNDVAEELGVTFRFGDDEIRDPVSNDGDRSEPVTRTVDETRDFYRARPGLDTDLTEPAPLEPVESLTLERASSLLAPDGTPLLSDALVPVRAESTATVTDADGSGDAVTYPEGTGPPLVGLDDSVAALAAPTFDDDTLEDHPDSDTARFVCNLFESLMGDTGRIRWDTGHGQSYTPSQALRFVRYAARNGYEISPGSSIPDSTGTCDCVLIATPSVPLSADEQATLASFVGDGGSVVLIHRSDLNDLDSTGALDDIADTLGAGFSFDDGTVSGATTDAVGTSNFNTLAFGALFAERAPLGGGTDYFGDRSPELSYYGDRATEQTRSLVAGETVTLSFDTEAVRYTGSVTDDSGALAASLRYDATGDGTRGTALGRAVAQRGYARATDLSSDLLDSVVGDEQTARENDVGMWSAANPAFTPRIDRGAVQTMVLPQCVAVSPGEDAQTVAESNDGTDTLVAAAPSARVGMVGSLLVADRYQEANDIPMSFHDNYTFLTNLLDELANHPGQVRILCGQGQGTTTGSLGADDLTTYSRFLEGVGIACEPVGDIGASGLANTRAVIVTPPRTSLSQSSVETLESFRDAGGAVVLLASARATADGIARLNGLAGRLGVDAAFDTALVTDEESNAGDPANLVTSNFARQLPIYEPFDPDAGGPSIPPIGDASNPPGNLDDDPLLEDVDGDGRGTLFDALAYYNSQESTAIRDNPDRFDFDGDGTSGTLFDALALYNHIS